MPRSKAMRTAARAPVAVITGAGRRLGSRLAEAFAERGYDIVLHYNRSRDRAAALAARLKKQGGKVLALRADLADVRQIRAMGRKIAGWTPAVDVLVHNAGVFPTASFAAVTPELWDSTLNLNLRSIFFLTRELLPLLHAASAPSVVAIASLGAYQPWRDHIPYCVSKAGVVMLTRALAKELAPRVRVNAVAPGIIVLPGEEERSHPSAERIPLRRYGTARDYVDTVLFLATTSAYITGQVLPLDGGTLGAT